MYQIAIIGAGQLGSRHLQGLKTARINMAIHVVDTSTDSLNLAKQRYEEAAENKLVKSIDFINSIDKLPSTLDLVIIASSSIPRARITETLIKSKQVKNIVFEKFLFPSLSDYALVADLLAKNNVCAWVNCPRRMFPFYEEIKDMLKDSQQVKLSVVGKDWGLGCNSIHFIDLFAMLTGLKDFELDVSGLSKEIIESKRASYIEFTGVVNGNFDNNHIFTFSSISECERPLSITIETEKYLIGINETEGTMVIKEGNSTIEKPIKILYQSQLTGAFVEQILTNNSTNLTSYEESSNLHIHFLSPLIKFYNTITGSNGDVCPIT